MQKACCSVDRIFDVQINAAETLQLWGRVRLAIGLQVATGVVGVEIQQVQGAGREREAVKVFGARADGRERPPDWQRQATKKPRIARQLHPIRGDLRETNAPKSAIFARIFLSLMRRIPIAAIIYEK